MTAAPGIVRDAIFDFLGALGTEASIDDIVAAVEKQCGPTPSSSVRSYLNLNTPGPFERTGRGRYRLTAAARPEHCLDSAAPVIAFRKANFYHADCFAWLAGRAPRSIHAVVTDPPYGLVEYSGKEQAKLRNGRGGVWRVPPSFDGHKRSPLPRFTVLTPEDRIALHAFFKTLAILLSRACVPGANVVVASNPLLAHVVAGAMAEGGLELRGHIARLVMTMRGGDRPKNAHYEFETVSVMPRSQWEPWVVMRVPLEGRVQDNLRKWKTGGFRRPSDHQPFGDVIRSAPTSATERKIGRHPSLKPQAFLRHLVRGVLPLATGVILDPFAGSGSTLAAANAVGYESVGIEVDPHYVAFARSALPALSDLSVKAVDPAFSQSSDARGVQGRGPRSEIARAFFLKSLTVTWPK